MLPYFAALAAWVFPRLVLKPHSEAEAESLPRAPFAISALACLMGISLTLSLYPATQATEAFGFMTNGPAGVTADYWWTRYLYELRFQADLLAIIALLGLYLLGFLLNLHFYALPTPSLAHRRAAYLMLSVGSAAAMLLCVDLVAMLFFCLLFLLALWLFARADGAREADRMLIYVMFGGTLLTAAVVMMWRQAGLTAMTELPLALIGSAPPARRLLGLTTLFGFVPLLAAFPLSRWLAVQTRETLRSAMVCGLLLLAAGSFLALRLLPGTGPLSLQGISGAAVTLGIVTLLWGAGGAWGSRNLRGLALWLTVSQSGLFLLALGLAARLLPVRSTTGLQAAFLVAATAPIALLALWSVASTVLARVGTDGYPGLGGLFSGLPVAAIAYLLAGLSLIGMPPLPGFWVLRLLLTGRSWALIAIALLADTAILYAVLNGFWETFLSMKTAPPLKPNRRWLGNQLALAAVVILGLTAALCASPVRQWVEATVRGVFLPGS